MAAKEVELNPVLPKELDGLRIRLTCWNKTKTLCFEIGSEGYGVERLLAGAQQLPATGEKDRYRDGGIRLSRQQWLEAPEELTLRTH